MNVSKIVRGILFIDFDGVLAVFRAQENRVMMDDDDYIRSCITNDNIFEFSRAPKTIKFVVEKMKHSDRVYVLSVVSSTFEARQKIKFIAENYPSIQKENIIFVSSPYYKKVIMSEIYNKYYKDIVNADDVFMIDDSLDVIHDIETNINFRCYHISEFVD